MWNNSNASKKRAAVLREYTHYKLPNKKNTTNWTGEEMFTINDKGRYSNQIWFCTSWYCYYLNTNIHNINTDPNTAIYIMWCVTVLNHWQTLRSWVGWSHKESVAQLCSQSNRLHSWKSRSRVGLFSDFHFPDPCCYCYKRLQNGQEVNNWDLQSQASRPTLLPSDKVGNC